MCNISQKDLTVKTDKGRLIIQQQFYVDIAEVSRHDPEWLDAVGSPDACRAIMRASDKVEAHGTTMEASNQTE